MDLRSVLGILHVEHLTECFDFLSFSSDDVDDFVCLLIVWDELMYGILLWGWQAGDDEQLGGLEDQIL